MKNKKRHTGPVRPSTGIWGAASCTHNSVPELFPGFSRHALGAGKGTLAAGTAFPASCPSEATSVFVQTQWTSSPPSRWAGPAWITSLTIF